MCTLTTEVVVVENICFLYEYVLYMYLCVEYIQPICLPAYGQRLIDGQMGTVTGWGNVGYYGESLYHYSFTVTHCSK